VLVEHLPWAAGIFLGLLTYKPHFGVLFPPALAASRNWRALASGVAMSLALAAAAAVVFGPETWVRFIHNLAGRDANLMIDAALQVRFQSVYGLLQGAGASPAVSWLVAGAVAAVAVIEVAVVWAVPIPHSLKAANLCVASLLASPYVLPWDLCILSIAAAFLLADGLARGFLPGERTLVLIGLFCLAFLNVALDLTVSAILLALVFHRILRVRPLPRTLADHRRYGGRQT
jgi:Glycosyltransferase family 87